jgi:hypothetical protein
MVIFGCQCSTPRPEPDPLIGFHVSSLGNLDSNISITDDYKDYLQKLPAEQKGYIGTIFFYENESGEHAVNIQIFEEYKNASWQHVLLYDKNNKRIKVTRYGHVKYQS